MRPVRPVRVRIASARPAITLPVARDPRVWEHRPVAELVVEGKQLVVRLSWWERIQRVAGHGGRSGSHRGVHHGRQARAPGSCGEALRFGLPVLVSPSRKSFLRTLTGRGIADSGPASLAAELYAAWQGTDYIRTHDVAALHDALTVLDAIAGSVPHKARAATPRDAPTAK